MRIKTLQFFLMSMLFTCLLITCKSSKPNAVIIVKEDGGFHFSGKVTMEAGSSGNLEPKLLVPGNVVIFRKDGNFGNEQGQSGHAYKITRNLKFEHIAKVDLEKSDEELVKQFIIKVKS